MYIYVVAKGHYVAMEMGSCVIALGINLSIAEYEVRGAVGVLMYASEVSYFRQLYASRPYLSLPRLASYLGRVYREMWEELYVSRPYKSLPRLASYFRRVLSLNVGEIAQNFLYF